MKPFAYFITVFFPLTALWGMLSGGVYPLVFPAIAFGAVPLVELFVPGLGHRTSAPGGEHKVAHDLVLINAFCMVWIGAGVLFWRVSHAESTPVELVGTVLCAGVLFGAIGINVAHEMGHRRSRVFQTLAKALLLPSFYMHFFIEHNRGHHRNIGTMADPATSRYGEVLYAFWFRSVVGGWLSAWRIEKHRLRNRAFWTRVLDNQMLRLQLVQVVALAAVGWGFGVATAGAWVVSAIVGALLLETVNYVEHYGLTRARLPDGRYERVAPKHSWTSDHPISRALLFELPRHADHHAFAGRPYGSLRHFSDAPQLPTGYSGMILLALLPPLFMRVMHPHIESESKRLAA
jgi:alkane 1-monooxygenase